MQRSKPNASLDAAQVRTIKLKLLEGVPAGHLGRLFGVSAESIRRISRGETWQSVVVEGEEALRKPVGVEVVESEPALLPPTPAEVEESLRRLEELSREETPSPGDANGKGGSL